MPTDIKTDLLEKLHRAEEILEEIALKLENGSEIRSIQEELHELKRVYKDLNKPEYTNLDKGDYSVERIETVGTIVEQITTEYKNKKDF